MMDDVILHPTRSLPYGADVPCKLIDENSSRHLHGAQIVAPATKCQLQCAKDFTVLKLSTLEYAYAPQQPALVMTNNRHANGR